VTGCVTECSGVSLIHINDPQAAKGYLVPTILEATFNSGDVGGRNRCGE